MLDIDKPLRNSIIVFLIIITLIFIIKPNIIYNHKKQKFKYYKIKGTTIMPIYILGILIAKKL